MGQIVLSAWLVFGARKTYPLNSVCTPFCRIKILFELCSWFLGGNFYTLEISQDMGMSLLLMIGLWTTPEFMPTMIQDRELSYQKDYVVRDLGI